MANENMPETTEPVVIEKRTKLVQIAIVFQVENDTEAITAKAAVDAAIKEIKGAAVHFSIQDRPKL